MPQTPSRLYRLLRWSERYTKTDMVYLARGGFWALAGQFSASLLSFILAIAMARLLPKEVYGDYKYILSLVAILGMFSLTGIGTAVFQSVARGFDGALQEGFWTNIRWSIAVFLGAFALAAYYFILGNHTLAFGVLIGGCFSPFLASANLSSAYLTAKKEFRRRSIYFDVIENLIPIGALLVTILLTQNPAIIAAVYFASNTLITLYLYQRTVRIHKPDIRKKDPHMFAYGGHLSAMGLLTGIAGNIDQVLLFHFVGPVELAIYNFAIAILDQAKGPLKMLDSMIQAKFANRSDLEIRSSMFHKILWLFSGSILFVLFYWILAPYLYEILFPAYTDAVFYSRLFSISWLCSAFTPAASYLSVKKKVREQYAANVSTSLFQIAALVVGVVYWGLLGLIIARVVTRTVQMLINYLLYVVSPKFSSAR